MSLAEIIENILNVLCQFEVTHLKESWGTPATYALRRKETPRAPKA